MRRGISLPELMLVLVIIGIVAAIALPRTHRLLESLAVEGAARQIRAAHFRAATTAIVTGHPTTLELDPDSLRIRTVNGVDTTTIWRAPGPRADGITLTGPAHPLVYSPLGVTMGASNGTWHLAYRSAVRDVIVSRLGRLRIR